MREKRQVMTGVMGEAEDEGDVFHDVVCVDGKIGADCRRVREVA